MRCRRSAFSSVATRLRRMRRERLCGKLRRCRLAMPCEFGYGKASSTVWSRKQRMNKLRRNRIVIDFVKATAVASRARRGEGGVLRILIVIVVVLVLIFGG